MTKQKKLSGGEIAYTAFCNARNIDPHLRVSRPRRVAWGAFAGAASAGAGAPLAWAVYRAAYWAPGRHLTAAAPARAAGRRTARAAGGSPGGAVVKITRRPIVTVETLVFGAASCMVIVAGLLMAVVRWL